MIEFILFDVNILIWKLLNRIEVFKTKNISVHVIIAFHVLVYINANTYIKVVLIFTTIAIVDLGKNIQN